MGHYHQIVKIFISILENWDFFNLGLECENVFILTNSQCCDLTCAKCDGQTNYDCISINFVIFLNHIIY